MMQICWSIHFKVLVILNIICIWETENNRMPVLKTEWIDFKHVDSFVA